MKAVVNFGNLKLNVESLTKFENSRRAAKCLQPNVIPDFSISLVGARLLLKELE